MLDMFAVPAGQSQHTFGALVAVVTAIGAADKLEDLRKAGINSAAKLAAALPFAAAGNPWGRPFGQVAAARAARGRLRHDQKHVRTFRSCTHMQGDPCSVSPLMVERTRSRTSTKLFWRTAMRRVPRHPSSQDGRRGNACVHPVSLDPLPLTQEVIFKVGASLRKASTGPALSTSVSQKQRHREAEYPWTDALDLAVQQAVRSISRGLGPSRPKKDLFVDRACPDLPGRLAQAYDRLGVPREHRFAEPLSVVTVALWFLLRGIEIANVKCKDVSFVRNLRQVKLALPVSKTDPQREDVLECMRASASRHTIAVAGRHVRQR